MKTRSRRERERMERERDTGFDFQCARCYKVFAGPDAPLDPGHEVVELPIAGEHVSHTWCDECLGEIGLPPDYVEAMDRRHGPEWRERLAELREELREGNGDEEEE